MKHSTYKKYVGKRVQLRHDAHNKQIGTIVDSTTTNGWWLVEWPDGKKSNYPLRSLVILDDEPA
jgi:hypothetical protein